ncbi:hypothetical protein EX30DRAFT_345048 [Ascodesmis nigricans]|uniref:DUF7918 domain-containing protein n=1 Tax=Ascodesmis nigricans TaxID=341454 RepID=A0A4V3SHH4_9PEZI|nr:hypothetical protein EX30DRAFT_345048 [Ascodesmis nigricans]
MPSLNGISCGIYTHDGRLDEYAQSEIRGGLCCYVPARSGQQFWLTYRIEKPIRAKAMSIEFWVDGNRIDTQFPLASPSADPPSVGPIASTINSQYSKDERGTPHRRDIFFMLEEERVKQWPYWLLKGSAQNSDKMGTIECKVYRAEKTGVWEGTVSPEAIPATSAKKSMRSKGVSHRARLGAPMLAAKTTRYTFRNLDDENTPFAYFKFYYRSYKFLQINHIIYAHSDLARPVSPSDAYRMPAAAEVPKSLSRKLSRRRSESGLKKERSHSVPALSVDLGTPFPFISDEKKRADTPIATSNILRKTSQSVLDLHASISHLEAEFANFRMGMDNSDMLQSCYEKLGRLKRAAEKIRYKDDYGRRYSLPIAENPREEESAMESEASSPTTGPVPLTLPSITVKLDKGKGRATE